MCQSLCILVCLSVSGCLSDNALLYTYQYLFACKYLVPCVSKRGPKNSLSKVHVVTSKEGRNAISRHYIIPKFVTFYRGCVPGPPGGGGLTAPPDPPPPPPTPPPTHTPVWPSPPGATRPRICRKILSNAPH